MAQNTRFALSIHALCMLAEEDKTATSQEIAEALQTNPVVVRRMLASLHAAKIISSNKGPNGGSRLARSPKQINLGDVYRASGASSLFHLPEGSAKNRGTVSAMGGILKKAQACFEEELEQTTLNQLLKKAAKRNKKK
jgi:Rrf2 family protein